MLKAPPQNTWKRPNLKTVIFLYLHTTLRIEPHIITVCCLIQQISKRIYPNKIRINARIVTNLIKIKRKTTIRMIVLNSYKWKRKAMERRSELCLMMGSQTQTKTHILITNTHFNANSLKKYLRNKKIFQFLVHSGAVDLIYTDLS